MFYQDLMNQKWQEQWNTFGKKLNTVIQEMDTNSKHSKTSDSHRLLLNLTDKRDNKYVALSNIRMYCTWKNIKKVIQNSNTFES